MTKKIQDTTTPVLYDATAQQQIPLILTKGAKTFRVEHTLNPLSNERYFELQEDLAAIAEKVKAISSQVYEPKDSVWNDLAVEISGYKPRDDWKAGVPSVHRSEAVNALIYVNFDDNVSRAKDDDLWDIEDLIEIRFSAMFSGTLCIDIVHSFRAESKAEMDEYLAIESGSPIPGVIASAQKLSRAERLFNLGKKLLKDTQGYAPGSDVPAWHLAASTESFFVRQIAQART